MAQVFDILSDLEATGRALGTFARLVREWPLLSDRLFDIREGLAATELSLEAWQQKFDIRPDRQDIYLQVLFGHQGCGRIGRSLESIDVAARAVRNDVDSVVGQAARSRPQQNSSGDAPRYSDEDVEIYLRRIQSKPSRSRRFIYSTINHTDDLEMHLEHLHRKLTLLERLSDFHLTNSHPNIFLPLHRLPGRRNISPPSVSHHQHKLLDGLAARKDAELLYRASLGQTIHIGLSVPQIHKRDFAFLIALDDTSTMQEVLMHPVKITAVNDTSRVQSTMATAIPSLINNTHESCYMLPLAASSAGFQVSIPPSAVLAPLEFKHPLSTLIRGPPHSLMHQVLCAHDQVALACGLAHSALRLIGSPWLGFLDCGNVRCRQDAKGRWTSMLDAGSSDAAVTDTLEDWIATGIDRGRDSKELVNATQIFRIGLVLAELALHSPIGHITFDPPTSTVNILVQGASGISEVVSMEEIAAEVERKSNVFLGNMVGSCLSILHLKEGEHEKRGANGESVEAVYYEAVLGQTEELEKVMRDWRRGSPADSIVGTPRSARSARSGVYIY